MKNGFGFSNSDFWFGVILRLSPKSLIISSEYATFKQFFITVYITNSKIYPN